MLRLLRVSMMLFFPCYYDTLSPQDLEMLQLGDGLTVEYFSTSTLKESGAPPFRPDHQLNGAPVLSPETQLLVDEQEVMAQLGSDRYLQDTTHGTGLLKEVLPIYSGSKDRSTSISTENPNVTIRKKNGGCRPKDLARRSGLGGDACAVGSGIFAEERARVSSSDISESFGPLRAEPDPSKVH